MDKVNEFLKKNYRSYSSIICEFWMPCKRIECADGYSISVQASEALYCEPRKNKSWPYSRVELGYPNRIDELISEYADDDERFNEQGNVDVVYGYVPIELVNELIEKHGGIVNM